MIYNNFKNLELSRLGFGTMRLPVKEDGSIDEDKTREMVDYAIKNGVNYFDTAYPYHDGFSEVVIGKILSQYPRDSFYLATKYPGHQISSHYDPKEVFEHQLKKCNVDYFDFYLLHNVNEGSISVYKDQNIGIIDYFVKQKELGKIKHLGFSTHADLPCLKKFLDLYADKMEFCQIQFNYIDQYLQHALEKYHLLTSYNIPVWIMEPVRGGKLAKLDSKYEEQLKLYRPNASIASWAFNYLLQFDNVKMILSGMSTFEQVKDNVNTFNRYQPLNTEEKAYVNELGKQLINGIPCTGCGYCLKECTKKLNIPKLLSTYNDIAYTKSFTPIMFLENLDEVELPSNCINCKKCTKMCPQSINIPEHLQKLSDIFNSSTKWKDICIEREKAAALLKNK